MTTVGYGDLIPVTTGGRIVGAAMMITGLCFLAILTGTFAGWFTSSQERDRELAAIRSDLNQIKIKLAIKDGDGTSIS